MIKNKILVVEDEKGIRSLIQLYLESKGFIVYPVSSGQEALGIVKNENLSLILLDIEMPYMDGFEVCQKIRQMKNIPIIFISSSRELADKVRSFELGGDDYITKPFDFVELEARVRANIRRYKDEEKKQVKKILQYNNLEIHLDRYECYLNGKLLPLSTREMEILFLLAQHPNQVWSAEQLYDRIWGYDSLGDVQTIKVHISNIRRKLDQSNDGVNYIQTVRGFGYKFTS
ncbi:response regulator transcription factor [Pseudogracilibacillus auburnensis]|uniref:DNA-binding response OmpR family regulator n=1 Tax=Pseudogracilibacillus auburnensis TaxID=1494959 RepID=A0A2V3VYF1_9BACI|nr:response regulator transcription factor [Pseudogracilibacillus auburnensis]MBO1002941.1 response regulator transcription factor [Pseudogracilibacillus auburnensis]PXW87037.1 DNA-binding response OmpR family regulator [Pseudogracilibacillus auburnensis]